MNVDLPAPAFSKHRFWKTMIICLCTTQQKSGKGSRVWQFEEIKPFPLSYQECKQKRNLQKYIEKTLSYFKLRRSKRISEEVEYNFNWLENGGWKDIKICSKDLLNCRERRPHRSDRHLERETANIVRINMKGFGPKQSRNLWQTLGLTRYEIPIDSRLTKWFSKFEFPLRLTSQNLSDPDYYNFVLDGIQEMCYVSGIYPCVLDAAIFSSFDK